MRSHPAPFQQYNGEDTFVYENQQYYRDRFLGEGLTACVNRFVSSTVTLSSLPTQVALKAEKMTPHQGFCEGEAFAQEARLNKAIYGLGEFSGTRHSCLKAHYILMPYFEGELLSKVKFKTIKESVLWFIRIAFFVHSKMHVGSFLNPKTNNTTGVVHGDLKANNIILQAAEVKVIDFGLAAYFEEQILLYPAPRIVDDRGRRQSIHAAYPHIAPELFKKKTAAEPSQDAYALGFLLFLMVSTVENRANTENVKILTIMNALRHSNPKERLSITDAIEKLHIDFCAEVVRPMPTVPLTATAANQALFSENSENQIARNEHRTQPVITAVAFGFFNRQRLQLSGQAPTHAQLPPASHTHNFS